MLLMPLVLVASMGWTQHKRLCLAQEAMLEDEAVSCCMASQELTSCAEQPLEMDAHNKDFCEDPKCCTDEIVVVEQSITELIQGSSSDISLTALPNVQITKCTDLGLLEHQVRTALPSTNSKPPDRGKPIRILVSCFRC